MIGLLLYQCNAHPMALHGATLTSPASVVAQITETITDEPPVAPKPEPAPGTLQISLFVALDVVVTSAMKINLTLLQ